jgi:tetratricopeptide (TPR) repeat protein
MKKDNILFGIIGLLLGVIFGFLVTNFVNQGGSAGRPGAAQSAASALPPGHPPLDSNAATDQQSAGMQAAVQEAIAQAHNEPNNFDAQLTAAQMFYQIGRYDEAMQFLMKANQLKPDHYETIVSLGNTNFDAQNYEAAEKWYLAALAKKPDDVNVRTDLGLTFLFRQPPDYDKAIKEFRRSLEKDPNHEQSLQDIVVALTSKGETAEAHTMLDRLVKVNPQNSAIPELRRKIESVGAPESGPKR